MGAAPASSDTQPLQDSIIAEDASPAKQPERSTAQRLTQPPAAAQPPAGPQQPQGDQRQQRQHERIQLPREAQAPGRDQLEQEQQGQQQCSARQVQREQHQAQAPGQGQEAAVAAAEAVVSPATTQGNRNALDWSEVSYGRSSCSAASAVVRLMCVGPWLPSLDGYGVVHYTLRRALPQPCDCTVTVVESLLNCVGISCSLVLACADVAWLYMAVQLDYQHQRSAAGIVSSVPSVSPVQFLS